MAAMWITKDVDLPDRLIAARSEGKLVVFVGSGASAGPPSNLPLFKELAEQVASQSNQSPPDDNDDLSEFLGGLHHKGLDVHQQVRDIIGDRKSRSTRIHRAIVQLFSSPSHVRIVTTNYDRHLGNIIKRHFGAQVKSYRAPALPLGRDFTGVVHLHGCVDQEPRHLVVTDSDFGTAYLLDAWAARFLEAMFHHDYVVLFVGYSHSDVVMKYLARGLRGSAERFAFVPSDEETNWRKYNITPVVYPHSPDHRALTSALEKWVERSRMGFLDHDKRIADLLRTHGTLDPVSDSYLAEALTKIETTNFFCNHARGLDWVPWLENQPAFQKLFSPAAPSDDVTRVLAYWFAEHVAIPHPDAGFSVLQRQGGRLSPILATVIAETLHASKPNPETKRRWVVVLLSQDPTSASDLINYLLFSTSLPAEKPLALFMFDHLTRPTLRLRPSWSTFASDEPPAFPRVETEPALLGDQHCLNEAWTNNFKPHLNICADELVPIVARNLFSCSEQLQMFRSGGESWDALSMRRSAIEPHGQDGYQSDVDVLIDAARDVLEELLRRNDGSGAALLQLWSGLAAPLFQRLVVHGWTERMDVSSDEKLRWLCAHHGRTLVEGGPSRHEVFRLVRSSLGSASIDVKNEVLELALREPQLDYDADASARATYNLVYWLTQSDPDFKAATDAFNDLQARHPHFGKREFPDLDTWSTSGSGGGPESPVTLDALLALDIENKLSWLRSYKGEHERPIFGPSRSGLLCLVANAASSDFAWGKRLADTLIAAGADDSDLWLELIEGWRRRNLTAEEWAFALPILNGISIGMPLVSPISSLLRDGVRQHGQLPLEHLESASTLAARLWAVGNNEQEQPWLVGSDSGLLWVDRAIHHWGGHLAEFWTLVVAKRWGANTDSWTGLPEETRDTLEEMLANESHAGDSARTLLAGDLNFFFAADEDWTKSHLLVLLDWTQQSESACQQAWDGFLSWGRWNDHTLPLLLPHFRASFSRLGKSLQGYRRQFTLFLAGIACYSSAGPLADGWLPDFVAHSDPESLEQWAGAVARTLSQADPDVAHAQWDRWILPYWGKRLQGIPKPLSPEEATDMVVWLTTAGKHYEDAVDIAIQSDISLPRQGGFLYKLREDAVVDEHPRALTKLLATQLKNTPATGYFGACSELGDIVPRLAPHAEPADYILLCDQAARLGCSDAASWRALRP